MADETLNGVNAFKALQGISRKSAAYGALQKQYGDIAGDPAAAAELQKVDESTQAFPLQQQARQQAIATSKQAMETNAATEAEKQRVTRGNELLSGALFIQNARKRDPNVDVGQLFDRIAPTLNLDPQAAAAARASLVADPGAADDIVTAFRLKQGAATHDPAAVQEYDYYKNLKTDQERANYLLVKRASFNAVRDVGGVPTAIQVAPGATAVSQTPLSTLPAEVSSQQQLAGGKAAGGALGKVQGEKTASDLPLSNTEQVKATQVYETAIQGFDVADKSIKDALADTNWLSAGPLSHLPSFANPAAAALQSDLLGTQSQIVLKTITDMKEASKTGATGLGSLSDREGALIQSKLGAVLQATSPQRLKRALTDLQTQMAASRGIFERAYVADQKARAPAAAAPAAQGSRTEGNNVILKWNPAKGDFE